MPGRKRPVSIADPKARAWAGRVEAACRQAPRMGAGPVAVRVWCYFPTDKRERWGRPHTARPDADNLAKMLLDCAERAGTLPKGDAKVARLAVQKLWARAGGAVMDLTPWATESLARKEDQTDESGSREAS